MMDAKRFRAMAKDKKNLVVYDCNCFERHMA